MFKINSKYLSAIDEPKRVKVVKQFESLNLKYNQQLSDILAVATKTFKAPIAFITLLDGETQWIKVSKGLAIEKTPQHLSFCTHTIKNKCILVVNDALLNPRFNQNPYVINEPKIRFYAGIPLVTPAGYCIGTLCVMDKKPHKPTAEQKMILTVLAQNVSSVMEFQLTMGFLNNELANLKVVQKTKSQNELKLRAMFESLPDAYFLLGKNCEILDFNKVAYHLIQKKYNTKLAHGRTMSGFLNPEHREEFLFHFQNALKGESVTLEKLKGFIEGDKIWKECSFEPVINDIGEIIGVSYTERDINKRKLNELKIIDQKEALMKIAQIQSHDYRGPVATILGLMNLIENDNYVASKEYLLMLHNATKKLDEKIHDVVNLVNDKHL